MPKNICFLNKVVVNFGDIFSKPCQDEKMSAKKPGFELIIPAKDPGTLLFSGM
jgi:hypothetical protein